MEAVEHLIERKMLSKDFAAMILQQFDQSALQVIQTYSQADEPIVLEADDIAGFKSFPEKGKMVFVLDNVSIYRIYPMAKIAAFVAMENAIKANLDSRKQTRGTQVTQQKKPRPRRLTQAGDASKEAEVFVARLGPKIGRLMILADSPMAANFPSSVAVVDQEQFVPIQVPIIPTPHHMFVAYKRIKGSKSKELEPVKPEPEFRVPDVPKRIKESRMLGGYDPSDEATAPKQTVIPRIRFQVQPPLPRPKMSTSKPSETSAVSTDRQGTSKECLEKSDKLRERPGNRQETSQKQEPTSKNDRGTSKELETSSTERQTCFVKMSRPSSFGNKRSGK
jgi:hypothetical protein